MLLHICSNRDRLIGEENDQMIKLIGLAALAYMGYQFVLIPDLTHIGLLVLTFAVVLAISSTKKGG